MFKGAALAMIEAMDICPPGRIGVNCPGLYNDARNGWLESSRRIVHTQSGLLGGQLSHAGRNSSTQSPWIALRQGKSSARAEPIHGGRPKDVVGPSRGQELSWDGKRDDDPAGGYWAPLEMGRAETGTLVNDFARQPSWPPQRALT